MSDLRSIPLEQLRQQCPPLNQQLEPAADAAWHELLHRALVAQNDAAWDAMINSLWISIFTWLYGRAPNLSPAAAERLAQQVLLALRREYLGVAATAQVQTTTMLIGFLQEQIALVLTNKETLM